MLDPLDWFGQGEIFCPASLGPLFFFYHFHLVQFNDYILNLSLWENHDFHILLIAGHSITLYIISQGKMYSMSTKIFVVPLLSLLILLSNCPHRDYMTCKAFSLWTLFFKRTPILRLVKWEYLIWFYFCKRKISY